MDGLKSTVFRNTLQATWAYMHSLDNLGKNGAFCALYDLIIELNFEEEYQDWKRAVLAVAGADPSDLGILGSFGWEAIEEGIRKIEGATEEIMAAVRDANEALREAQKIKDETQPLETQMHETFKIIAVDFDGTLCENRYPAIGAARADVLDALCAAQDKGARVILWTCRCGDRLKEAVDWCAEQGLYFDAVNENLPELVRKYGNDPRKVSATEYWDDRAVRILDIPDWE